MLQMAKKWYLEVNEIHMNTPAQHSRGFTVYKMIIDSKVLVLPGNIRPEPGRYSIQGKTRKWKSLSEIYDSAIRAFFKYCSRDKI